MIVGGALTEAGSWRWVFFVNVPVGLVLALAAPRVLTETPRRPGRFDALGAVVSTGGMSALVYALIRVGSDGWGDGRAVAAFAAAAALLAAFVAVEARARRPLMPLWLLTGRDRAASYLTQLCLAAAMFGAFFFLTQYLQQVLGYGPLRAGAAFLPMVGMQFAVVRTAPRLLARVGARRSSPGRSCSAPGCCGCRGCPRGTATPARCWGRSSSWARAAGCRSCR
ncbi:MFS transporter [Actinomadura luteofluorescens]